MSFDYKSAKQYQGQFVKFRNDQGEWISGKVVKADEDGFVIKELDSSKDLGGAGYGFWGPRYGFRPRPFFRPGFRRYPFAGVFGLTLLPFFFW